MIGFRLNWLVAATLCLLVLSSPAGATSFVNATGDQGKVHESNYPSTSWAMGIVAPEGAGTFGGGTVKWESASNLTALVTLPNITNPGGIVYAVLSVMAADGSVMQVAAGVYPNSSRWLAYSWIVEGVQSSHPTYGWILNSSSPTMNGGDRVSLSIFRRAGGWTLKVADATGGAPTEAQFPAGVSASLMMGDQEAFALESYSRTAGDFQDMGNLTLDALLVDGRQVTSGVYSYGGWDPTHSPVFVVGSSGSSPPVFITLQGSAGSAFSWGYSDVWGESKYGGGTQVLAFVIPIAAALIFVLVAYRVTRKSPTG